MLGRGRWEGCPTSSAPGSWGAVVTLPIVRLEEAVVNLPPTCTEICQAFCDWGCHGNGALPALHHSARTVAAVLLALDLQQFRLRLLDVGRGSIGRTSHLG